VTESLRVEPTEATDFGPCECCGAATRRVWGFVHNPAGTRTSYFVQWAVGRVPDHGALFDLIIDEPGAGTTTADRLLVTLEYRLTDAGSEFMVVDSADRPAAKSELVTRALARSDVIGQAVAEDAFAVVDAVLAQDVRVAELLGQYQMSPPVRKSWWRFW
jgi:hypothetical protein